MNDEILQKLGAVIHALNCIQVSGKNNLINLSGSISILEEMASLLSHAATEVAEKDEL